MEILKPGYTRVSDILAIFQAYAHVPKDKLKKAQDTGTIIHDCIENYFKDEFTPLPFKKIPYMESFLKWATEAKPLEDLIETRLYDPKLKITGRVDLCCSLNDQRVLVDFKTGSWAHPSIWYLQGCFYRYLLAVNDCDVPDRFQFLQLQADGSYPRIFDFTYKQEDWQRCLEAINLYKYFFNSENTQKTLS